MTESSSPARTDAGFVRQPRWDAGVSAATATLPRDHPITVTSPTRRGRIADRDKPGRAHHTQPFHRAHSPPTGHDAKPPPTRIARLTRNPAQISGSVPKAGQGCGWRTLPARARV